MALVNESNAVEVAKAVRELKDDARRIGEMFARSFAARAVKWKPQMVKQNRAMAMAYIDARLVMDRLDEGAGVGGWRDEYTVLPDGSVECRLSVLMGGQWVTKADVGSPSEQPDGGDRLKAAYSDALKRAAVKFGIGRYLYRLPSQWVDYDPVRKQLTRVPTLPAWAVPKETPAHEEPDDEPEPAPEAKAEPPKPQQPQKPANTALRAKYAQALARCKDREEYAKVCAFIGADFRAGVLTPEDRAALGVVAKDMADKFAALA